MSHELRTPLSGIIGAIDLLKSIKLDVDYEHLLEIAETCSQHLLVSLHTKCFLWINPTMAEYYSNLRGD